MSRRLFILKSVLWALVGVLTTVTIARFVHGLGAVSNLSDAAPWGLWIGFDVMGGVALAAGGFVLAATVYIFGLEDYRPFVRPAILTAFLGYVAVAVGLLYDLGLPWHIWHPAVYWQYHSVLFEVATCVMLYLTVLAMEFAPVVLEHPRFGSALVKKIHGALKTITIPLVIAGITLSTLHQSSLGSLFLITPYRLHPLWYSPIMYVLFFVSAVGLGLMMVVLESLLAARFLDHPLHVRQLAGLGKAAAVVLLTYVVLRVGDLALRGVLASSFDGSWQSMLFVLELSVSAILPAVLLLDKRIRSSVAGLAACATLVVGGMVWYRLDVSIVAFARPTKMGYFPSWMEFAVSLGIVSVAALVFIFVAERFRVYTEEGSAPPTPRPSFDPATLHGLLPSTIAAPRRFSLIAVAAAAVTVALLPREAVLGARPEATPAAAARAVQGREVERAEGGHRLELATTTAGLPSGGPSTPLLLIDGNRNDDAVLFDHEAHVQRSGGDTACGTCHHLDAPYDRHPSCAACHRDMYESASAFDHALHVRALNDNHGCEQCHQPSAVKTAKTATACVECHADLIPAHSFVERPADRWKPAVGYVDAMHGLCQKCHEAQLVREPTKHPETLGRCDWCHDADRPLDLRRLAPHPRVRTTVRLPATGAMRGTPSGPAGGR
jgi:Ni/Fe-hydrogenase subunit HybB-like protein